jgi:hypothetical protein
MAAAPGPKSRPNVPPKHDPEWSESERARLRELAKESEHRAWLREKLKTWATWIAAVGVGVKFTWDGLKKVGEWLGWS